MYRIFMNDVDITNYTANISWKDSVDTLGVELTFDLATSREDRNFDTTKNFTLGDPVQILNEKGEVFLQTIIVSESPNAKYTSFTAYDLTWYLNKSTIIKQFKKMIGNDCVKSICEEIGIKVEVVGLDTKIDKIYKDKTVSEIIWDIIGQCSHFNSKKYFIEMDKGVLKIGPFKKIKVKGEFKAYENQVFDVFSNVESLSLNRSIVDLKNSILVISGDKDAVRVAGKAQDEESINKYGMLQEVVQLDEKEHGKANLVAKNELKKMNRIAEDFTLEILGDDKIKSGRVIDLDLPLFNIKGEFVIKESSHTLKNGIHKANIKVEAYYE